MPATRAQTQAARAFLRRKGVPFSSVPPRKLANAAEETGKTFSELLRFLGEVLMGSQGANGAPIATSIARSKWRR